MLMELCKKWDVKYRHLNFNKELLDMDQEIGDYVIVHEISPISTI
ncbi:MAG: DUF45 domain-containing protein [Candidatus Methanoperedens sp.]|nr:DUF45 domain-containing protein [Candidatus Methanoperedens sp.]MCE8427539.1 DUF45 domain-containing protein [Candidatus Methanoperedens sp.]